MTKAKHVGKNLDSAPVSTDIQPMAAPTIVNATGLTEDVPETKLSEGNTSADTQSKSAYHKNEQLNDIYERRNKQLAELIAPVENENPEDVAVDEAVLAPSEEKPDVSQSSEAEVPGQPPADGVAATSPQSKYKIIVDGQPIEYTLEELQQQAQLGVAARKRFEEAAELRRQAEQIMASRQNFQPQQIENQNTRQQLADIPVEQELRDIAKRMNYGSEEEQVKALQDAGILFNKQQGRNQPTTEQLVQIATQNAMAALSAQQEQEILRKEFPDIASDVPLAYATDLIANQLAQKYSALGQNKTRLELLMEAGTEARAKYLRPVAQNPSSQNNTAAQPTVAVDSNKIERKRAAPQTPTAASAVARTSSDGNSGASAEMIAQAMRRTSMNEILKSRGQQVV